MKAEYKPVQRLTRTYIIALGSLFLLTIIGQILIGRLLSLQSRDTTVINIAGRQRMLSQNIVKNALLLSDHTDHIQFRGQQDKLAELVELWQTSHHSLLHGNSTLNIPSDYNSHKINILFSKLIPHYERIAQSCLFLQEMTWERKNQVEELIGIILAHESDFLNLMNQITFQYEAESQARIRQIQITEIIIEVIIFLVILSQVFFIFRPILSKVKEHIGIIKRQRHELSENIQELHAAEEELRQQAEEMLAQHEQIITKNHNLNLMVRRMKNSEKVTEKVLKKLKSTTEKYNEKNFQMTQSIRQALIMQQAMLPTPERISSIFPEFFIIYRPKAIVSGDFYWVHRNRKQVYCAVVDCTGHGVPGGFMSMLGNAYLSDIVMGRGLESPAIILEAISVKIRHTLKQDTSQSISGMDVAIFRYDKTERLLTFAGSKLSIYIIQNQEFTILKGDRKLVGGKTPKHNRLFQNQEIEIIPDTRVFMTSDGLIDQNNEARKSFGKRAFIRLLKQYGNQSMLKIKTAFENALDTHQGNADQRDDITVMGMVFE